MAWQIYNNYNFKRKEAEHMEEVFSNPKAKRKPKMEADIVKRIRNEHKLLDYNKKRGLK